MLASIFALLPFKLSFIFLVSDPNRWSKTAVKTELKKRKIVYEDKENKCDLVAILRKEIGEEVQREVKGILIFQFLFFIHITNKILYRNAIAKHR